MQALRNVFGHRIVRSLSVVLGLLVVGLGMFVVIGWPASTRSASASLRGRTASLAELEAILDTPGPITVDTVVGADWAVDRSGVIDLEDPRAREAGLVAGMEPIQIYLHALHHPSEGLFVIDTGVERALMREPERAAIRGIVVSAGHIDQMQLGTDTATWVAAQREPISAVFLTHLHLDHIAGLRDVPPGVPVVLGEGELESRSFFHVLTQPSVDRALSDHPLETWSFGSGARGEGVVDVLGDGSLWALEMPGHTRGSIAYVARTPAGAVLFTGDVCHTAWGWEHGVAPGTFTEDADANRESLARLRALAARHPQMTVRLGHQPSSAAPMAASSSPTHSASVPLRRLSGAAIHPTGVAGARQQLGTPN